MNWRRAKKQRLAGHGERNASRRLLFQELEPRVLYSADGAGGADALLDEAKAVELVVDNVRHDEPVNLSQETPPPIDLDALGSADARLPTREVVFVDSDTDGYEQLVEDLVNNSDEGREFDVVILDNDRDGIEQISEVLASYESLDAVHIISHGDDGAIDLGNANIDLARLNDSADAIAAWAGAFTETGDLLIYGCNLAAGSDGEAFVDTLARLTATDVAASDDLTGNLLLGGDWTLEYTTGAVETAVAVSQDLQENWDQVLVTYTVTTTAASGAGSLEEAINLANASGAVDDVIEFNIGGGGAQTIVVDAGGLPSIKDTVTIDATTQPGYAGEPLITLDGSATGGKNAFDFDANSDGSVVRGFKIIDFDNAGFLVKSGADNVTIAGNWIGTTGSGYVGPGVGGDGIDTRALNTTIGGLGENDGNVITNYGDEGINIQGAGVTGHLIQGNIIGLDPDGSTSANTGDVGIAIISGTGNTIGGTTTAARNIISNNIEGIEINTDDNVVQGNFIGTDISGALDRGNHSSDGIEIQGGAANNLIGGTAEGAGNLIAYNFQRGIQVTSGNGNELVGNTITSNRLSGIISTGTATNIVGNVVYDNSTGATQAEIITGAGDKVYHNTVHGSQSDGISVAGSNAVLHNNIVTGSAGYGIRLNGGSVTAESNNLITDAGTGPANLSGRANFALDASDLNADPQYIDAAAGDFRLTSPTSPAINAGIDLGVAQPDVNGSSPGLYSGAAPDIGTFESWTPVETVFIVTTTADSGIGSLREAILNANAHANAGGPDVIRFEIGTGPQTIVVGASGLPVITDAVIIDATTQPGYAGDPIITLDGSLTPDSSGINGFQLRTDDSTIKGFRVHSFADEGIEIDGSTGFGDNNTIQNNWVGIDENGAVAGNAQFGIMVTVNAIGNQIGGSGANEGNVVVGNGFDRGASSDRYSGIVLRDNVSLTVVEGNYVGIMPDGSTIAGNGDNGILAEIDVNNNRIGGIADGAENVVSGNPNDGIRIVGGAGTADGNTVIGNLIGTDSSGTVAKGNGDDGISLQSGATNNTVGGTTAAERNIISGNYATGVYLDGATTTGNVVQGNYIGTDISGTADLGNGKISGEGNVRTYNAGANTIGGTGANAGNIIAFGGGDGVQLQGTTQGMSILGNSMFSNAGLAIDINSDGVGFNDGSQSGTAPNLGMDTPVFNTATVTGGTLTLSGYVGSAPGQATFANARVEIFKASNDPGVFAEGLTYIDFLTTDASGNFSGALVGTGLISGDRIIATATDAAGNTSEFSFALSLDPVHADALWISTQDDVVAGGTPGIDTWTAGDVISFGGAGFGLEPAGTAGTFAFQLGLNSYFDSGDVDVAALHTVGTRITVGGGVNTLELLRGDVLFALENDQTAGGGATTYHDNDVLVFRPTVAGDYSSGAVFMLLDDLTVQDVRGITLVETDTVVGDMTLSAGSFLYHDSAFDFEIRHFAPTGVGTGTTTGAKQVFIDGAAAAPGPYAVTYAYSALDLIERDTVIAGQTIAAGTILTSLGSSGTIGSNNLSVVDDDVIALTVVSTTLGSGSSDAHATLLLDGSAVNLSANEEDITALSVHAANEVPSARPDGVSLAFDGTDIVEIADDPSLRMTDTLTMEAWFNVNVSATGSNIIMNKEGEYELGVDADTGEVQWAIADSGNTWGWHGTGAFVTPGDWNHVAVSYDGIAGEVKTYLNGKLVDTFSQSGSVGDVYPTFNAFTIGGRGNDADERFDGSIDDVRVWSTARSGAEILSNLATLVDPQAGLEGNWRFDEGSGTVAFDESGNGNHGVLGGGEGAGSVPTYQGYIVNEDTLLTVPAATGLLDNDFDSDGDSLTVTNVDTTGIVGAVTVNADGSFTYDPRGVLDSLDAGDRLTETFTYTAFDGAETSNTATVSITVIGLDDASSISGVVTGAVNEGDIGDAPVTASGTISISDPDADDSPTIADQASTLGDNGYGSFVLASGTWTYTLDQSAVQDLDAGDMVTDTITYTASDGNSQQITVTITGTADASVISGTVTGAVNEGDIGDAPVTATGTISINDPDADDSPTIADQGSTVGDNAYGSFVLTGGTWTYTLDQSTVQDLDPGDMVTDTITYTASDGNSQLITVTITGTNDPPVLTQWFDNAWTARKALTIDATRAAGDVTDFPVLISLAVDPELAAQALANGDDIIFTAADGVTLLAHEIEYFDQATGELRAWVKTDLSASIDTSIYVYYGNAGATNQENPAGVWSSGYVGVYHLGESPTGAAGEIVDSSGSGNHAATEGAMNAADSVPTAIGNGLAFDGANDMIRIPDSASLDGLNDAATFSLWINWVDAADGGHQIVMTSSNRFSAVDGYEWASQGSGDHFFYPDATIPDGNYNSGSNPFTNGQWHHLAATMDFATKEVKIYVDGNAMAFSYEGVPANWTALSSSDDLLWGGNPDRASRFFTGMMDEIRLADVARSQAWIQTEASNQANPAAFYTVAGEETQATQYALTDINEDDANPVGDSVAAIIASLPGDRIMDPDADAVEGIAVVGVDDTNGEWQYDANANGTWLAFGGVSDAAAVLLDSGALVRFVPDPDYNGTAGDLTFRAWDRTSGSNGDSAVNVSADLSANGDNSTFSSTTDTATLNVIAVNDPSVISGTVSGAVAEGDIGDAPVTASGSISISDVDAGDNPVFNDVAATAGDNGYGSFVLSSGTWTYTLDQSSVQDLDAGDMVTDTITYTASDGNSQQITVTITGTDDTSVISGTFTGAVNEGNVGDAPVTATGTISISDVDADDTPTIADQASTVGDNAYGAFVLSGGTWTYTLDQSAVQDLDAGDMVTDTITYTASDGNSQQITVTITGTDDASVISGTVTGAVNEGDIGDAPVTATGTISISDVDADDSPTLADQASTFGDNAYGSFVLSSGTWTYTLDQSAVQDLDAGDMVTDTITYTASDGNSQQITVTITGTADASVISGTVTGAVNEGDIGDAPVTATGTISISDADADDTPTIADQGSTVGDNAYGAFVLASGTWTYTLDQSAVQDLDAGDMVTDTITYTASDGNSQQITVTITGTDDASVISGTVTGAVNEGNVGDAPVTATGAISISDVDADDTPTIADQGSTVGDNAYGSFVLASGTWTYTLDQSAVQDLDAGDMVTDTITYTASDGNSQQITVTITGTADASVISGTVTGAVNEGDVGDAPVTATGTISINDPDADDSPTIADQASTVGDNAYGAFVLSSGTWTYTLDQSTVQDLDAGDMVTDTITYTASDGNSQQITITITGTDDASVISGTVTGAVNEGDIGDAPVTATGAISISDVDADDSPTLADQGSTVGDNAYGSFVLASGTWTYTLDQSAVQDLDAGDMVTDTITYTASDGNSQQITVTITGTADASVISGTVTGAVNEGDIGDAPVTATGTISINDPDADDSPTIADQGSTVGDNAYGAFVLASGTWTYTLDQSAVQDLDAGDMVTDTITYTASDGNSQQITVTITGTDDASVISGTVTGAVNEGDIGDAPVTASGAISISDVDADDSPTIADQGSTAGDNAYGAFVLSSGTWTYTLDQSAVQDLDAGDMVTDTITYIASDGNSQQITVTITGTDDASVISGTVTGAVNEGDIGDAPVTATGAISISDVDADDTPTIADQGITVGDNAYGSFVLSSGTWTYTLDQSAVQDLDAGDMVTDTITYTASDGNSQQITVTITGTADASVISGTVTGAVNEGDIGDAPVTATGTISISDADADDSPTIADQGSTVGDNAYGAFVLASGTWTYTLDQSAVQDLDAGDMVTDTITYTASDGNSQQITVTITGTDDASVISGTVTGAVNEGDIGDAPVTATGTISISDVDADDTPTIADQGSTVGDNAYGSFVLSSGTWTYTLDQSAVQDLDAGDMVTDTITYTASDGNSQQITVTITGTADASVISGTVTGAVNEGDIGDAPVTATGTISITDPDADDTPTIADQGSTVGDNAYGSFVLASGTWTYTLDQSAVQDLDAGDMVTDTITYIASDGNSQQITITITGTADASVISGTVTGSVNEGDIGDAPVTATGTISISDQDADDSPTIADRGSTVGDNAYGAFVLSSGTWTYTLDQSTVQDLDAGDMVTDTITYTASDGNSQQITVTITGTDDASVISGTVTGAVNEGDIGDAPVTATGAISIADVDADDSPTIADQGSTVGDNAYGSFVLASGTWTYTLDQSAVQDLDAGDMVTDTITYTASDGNSQQITITITGTADASVISGTVTGSVNEGDIGDAPVTATGTISINDPDADDTPTIADQGSTVGDNAYGAFVLSSGTWTYTLDQSTVQDLDAVDMVTDTITYTASDGNSQQITVTITGTDDASVISGTVTGAVNEGNVGDAPVTATGAISIADVDADDSPTIADQGSTVGDNAYGAFVLSSGTWTYTLDQSAVQDLDAGDMVTDTITYTASDGNSQQITVTITGTDDASVISGTVTGAVNEGDIGDAPVTATGAISISDADADDSPTLADQGSTVGDNAYGSFVLASGTWTYTLDQSTVQDLDAGDMVTDTITYTASDGNSQQITVTITGTDDASVISGTVTGAVNEGNVGDAPVTASGAISISDVDADDTPTIADQGSTVGDNAYGSFVLASGTWTYTLDQSTVQDLDAGDMVTDTITYTASDGNSQQITVTITGTDDASVISGTVTGAVNEGDIGDAPVTATGAISISDADADDTPTIADQASTVGDNAYGAFVLSSGTWTYTLDQSAVQDLDAGDMVTDTITYTASDGNSQQIMVTITGTDDASVISGTVTGAVNEGDIGDAPVTATGTISISDADADDTPTIAGQGSTVGDNAYGAFVLSSGTWTYTLDQSAVQDLDAGDMVTDTITYTASDGNSQQITVTITGTDDAAVITGSFSGAVNEGDVGDAPVTASGTISISDPDADDTPTFADVTVAATYGTLDLAGGVWTYTVDQSTVQDLDAGDTVNDNIVLTASNGMTQSITITLTGTDDASVVSGTFTGVATEGDIGDAPVIASGTLSISDVDQDDNPVFADVPASPGANGYGSFELTAGTWRFALDQAAAQSLDVGDTASDSFVFTASDGHARIVTVTIIGTADTPTTTGIAPLTVNEDAAPSVIDLHAAFDDVEDSDAALTYTVTAQTNPGLFSAIGNTGGVLSLSYTPDAYGTATVTLRATDTSGAFIESTFSINVLPVNDAPLLVNNTGAALSAGDRLTLSAAELHASDIDNPPAEVVYTLTANPGGGSVLRGAQVLGAGDSFTQADIDSGAVSIAAADDAGDALRFTFTVTDAAGGTAGVHTFAVTVAPGADEPTTAEINGAGTEAGLGLPEVTDDEEPTATAPPDAESETATDPAPVRNVPPPVATDLVLALEPTGTGEPVFVEPRRAPVERGEADVERNGYERRKATPAVMPVPLADDRGEADVAVVDGDADETDERITNALKRALDELSNDMDAALESEVKRGQFIMAAGHIGGASITAGVLAWLLRAGSLMASVLSVMPLWTRMDPLPVLLAQRKKDEELDDADDEEAAAARILDPGSRAGKRGVRS